MTGAGIVAVLAAVVFLVVVGVMLWVPDQTQWDMPETPDDELDE